MSSVGCIYNFCWFDSLIVHLIIDSLFYFFLGLICDVNVSEFVIVVSLSLYDIDMDSVNPIVSIKRKNSVTFELMHNNLISGS